jgi:uncharacterized protein (UPF0332 family)
MSFDWHHYLELAKHLNANANSFPDTEACYRSVVSRAYYAVYCLARNYIKQTDNVTFSGNDHKRLQDHLTSGPGQQLRHKIGNQLKQLHQVRIKADYADNLDELPVNSASKALAQAERIINNLHQLEL